MQYIPPPKRLPVSPIECIDRRDESHVAIAFHLLRFRHRQRPEVREKLRQIAARREGRR